LSSELRRDKFGGDMVTRIAAKSVVCAVVKLRPKLLGSAEPARRRHLVLISWMNNGDKLARK
jgi:hypothetical protein